MTYDQPQEGVPPDDDCSKAPTISIRRQQRSVKTRRMHPPINLLMKLPRLGIGQDNSSHNRMTHPARRRLARDHPFHGSRSAPGSGGSQTASAPAILLAIQSLLPQESTGARGKNRTHRDRPARYAFAIFPPASDRKAIDDLASRVAKLEAGGAGDIAAGTDAALQIAVRHRSRLKGPVSQRRPRPAYRRGDDHRA